MDSFTCLVLQCPFLSIILVSVQLMPWLFLATWSVIADLFTSVREAFLSALVWTLSLAVSVSFLCFSSLPACFSNVNTLTLVTWYLLHTFASVLYTTFVLSVHQNLSWVSWRAWWLYLFHISRNSCSLSHTLNKKPVVIPYVKDLMETVNRIFWKYRISTVNTIGEYNWMVCAWWHCRLLLPLL